MEVEAPPETRRRPLGPILAWLACAAWAAYWIREELGRPPAEEPAEDPGVDESLPWWPAGMLVGGSILLVVFAVQALRGRIRSRVRPSRRGSEAFAAAAAAWLLLDLLLYAAADIGFGEEFGLVLWLSIPFVTVGIGLAWPVLSGVDGRRSQAALGLTPGTGVLKEFGVGLLALPAVMAASVLLFLLYEPGPSHPDTIDEWLLGDDTSLRTYAVLFSVVQAPLCEECGFRGLLYRFLRDAGGRLPASLGIAAATLGTSFLFAVCHGYGFGYLPQLMLVGAAACVLREWRGSLLAPVALHFSFNAISVVRTLTDA